MVTRLISATGDEIKEMSPMDLKESIFKSEGRVVMGQHLLFAGPGLVRGVTNSELMFAFGADMVMLNTFVNWIIICYVTERSKKQETVLCMKILLLLKNS